MENQEKIIEDLFEQGVLINKDLLNNTRNLDSALIEKIKTEGDLLVVNSDYVDILQQPSSLVDWYEIDQYRVDAEKDRDDELYQAQLQTLCKSGLSLSTPSFSQHQELSSLEAELDLQDDEDISPASASMAAFPTSVAEPIVAPNLTEHPAILGPLFVIVSYETTAHKYEIQDFANFFVSRYRFIESILRYRREMENVTTINRLSLKKDREKVSIIGLISEVGTTKNGNLIITLEDPSGKIKILVSKNKPELYGMAKDLVFDEVIGITGVLSDKIIFVDNIIWPDIPANHEIKKGPEEEYVIFLSDIHYGSSLFLHSEFEKFLRWINGKTGNEIQRELAAKVKYIFIIGDLVDGVGVYPSQETELSVTSIQGQYEGFVQLLKQIPSDKRIIMCPGNHDVVHLAEPQPIFYKEFAGGLYDLPNATLVTNPALINIGKSKDFPGFDVLMYHGYSFDYYVANVESIRNGGGYHRADLIMKFLLKRRHLAPSFSSTPYLPSYKEDPLLIKTIPDFFVTGHIHYSSVANYRGITMISGSCWQGKTTFQEKLGHEPEPARVPVVNLKTREIKILKFL